MNSMKAWVGALMCGAIVCGASNAQATVLMGEKSDWVPFAIPGFATASFGITAVASLGAYYDEPGALVAMGYTAGALSGLSSGIYLTMAAAIRSEVVTPIFVPTGALNLGLAAASFALAATAGPEEAPPVMPIMTSDGSTWQAGIVGAF